MVSPATGTCLKMCPYQEMKWREKNKLLHSFEIQTGSESEPKADPNRVIKQFSRSAAGKSQQSPPDLRPPNILLKTMNYLITNIVPMDSVSWVEVYNFTGDRIQAIRQDITIQMIEDTNALKIYEKCVRFYVVSSYILCEESQSKFDQHLNSKQLSICLERVLDLYQKLQSEEMNEVISINISYNIIHYENFYRSENLIQSFSNDDLVKLTIRACISWIECNFIKFFRCIRKLPVILQISFFHHFGIIRRRTLKALSTAYSSSTCQFPLEILSHWLCLSNRDTLQLCQIYKINTKQKTICFNKKDFDVNAVLPKLTKEYLIELNLQNHDFVTLINGKIKEA